jgi:preprotein translocase subunit YajC
MLEQLTNFFITNAHAADVAGAPAPQGGGFSFVIMLGIFFVFIYFAIWRPQSKRAKEQQNLLGSLAKGDEIMTAGGMLGRIAKMNEQYITLTIANNIDIVVQKSSVVTVMPKGTLKSLE